MAAHSFGGYISGHYTLKYKQHVKALLLISPLGIRVKPDGEDDWGRFKAKSQEFQKQGGNPPSFFAKIFLKSLWAKKTSPFSIGKVVGR